MALEINMDNVAEGLRGIVQECFANVLRMLGKNNFLRWLDTKSKDEKLKTLIIDYMTEEEEKEHKNAGGFATRDEKRIAAHKGYSEVSTKTVLHHEFDHFLSSKLFSSVFSGFINEGMTEYLKQLHDKEGYKSYNENVELVKFIHSRIGDIFVKAYFKGECNPTFDKLKKYLGETEYKDFIDNMKSLYDIGYYADHHSNEYLKNFKEGKYVESISNVCVAILKGSIIEKADKLEFYKDGKLDVESIIKEIEQCNSMPSYVVDYLKKEKKFDALKEEICGAIIDKSHLLMGIHKSDKSKYIRGIISQDHTTIDQIEDDTKDVMSKLFELQFQNFQANSIQEFADRVLRIVSKFSNGTIDDERILREIHPLVSQYIIKYFGNDVDVRIVDDYINANINRGLNIDKMVDERERNVIDSKFRMINSLMAIEQRDNEYYLVEILPSGALSDHGVVQYENGVATRSIHLGSDIGKRVYSSSFRQFVFSEKIEDLQITGNEPYEIINDPLKVNGIMSLEQFNAYMKFRPIIEKTKDDIKKSIIVKDDAPESNYGVDGVFYEYGSDIKDYRTRKIDIEKLRLALKQLESFVPDGKKLKDTQMEYLYFLTEYAYDVKVDDESKELVEILYSAITSEDKQSVKSKLADYEGYMNYKRREIQDKKVEGLIFEDDKAREQYNTRKAEYEQTQRQMAQKEQEKYVNPMQWIVDQINQERMDLIQRTAYYTVIPDEEYETNGKYADKNNMFGLPYFLYPHSKFRFRAPGSRKIETELFKRDMQFAKQILSPEEFEELALKIANDTIGLAYGLYTDEEQREDEVREDFQYLVEALYNFGVNDTQIDEKRFDIANKKLNEIRQRGYKERGPLGGILMSQEVEQIYEYLCKLSETLSQEEVINAAKMMIAFYEHGKNNGDERREVETW